MANIAVKVKGDKAIVRKTMFYDDGKIAVKYGLTVAGEWIQVEEGESYPNVCILPVEHYEDEVEEVIIGTIYESAEDLRAMGTEVGDAGD